MSEKAQGASPLKLAFAEKIERKRRQVSALKTKHGGRRLCELEVSSLFSGMRSVPGCIHEPSTVDGQAGLKLRGHTVEALLERLPRLGSSKTPSVEGLFWLLLIGEMPGLAEVEYVAQDWRKRERVLPESVSQVLLGLSPAAHPMSLFSAALLLLQEGAEFPRVDRKKVPKQRWWEYLFEDVNNLIAAIPALVGEIYRNRTGKPAPERESIDWAERVSLSMGMDDASFSDFLRLFFILHSDHEGGNVSTRTCKLVGSALSDPYLAYSAALNGLAGPLHGLAAQEALDWMVETGERVGTDASEDELRRHVSGIVESGGVVPGYGHAVLRITDPRFVIQQRFAEEHFGDNKMFLFASRLHRIVPSVLSGFPKIQNPNPNIDAMTGVLLTCFGITDTSYYTVLFGAGRSIGALSGYLWDRAYCLPIERPKSYTVDMLEELFEGVDL
ncbi:MAG: citrate synthase [Amphiamblys sp. WSBS2006]|nr:MAG: citrate synthase [Amphiamblys sp. WSBS2006]